MSNSSKRTVVKYYLSIGYKIVGLELMKGTEPVMAINKLMKRSLQKDGLIPL